MLQDSDSSNKKLLKGLRLCASYILKFSTLRFKKKKNHYYTCGFNVTCLTLLSPFSDVVIWTVTLTSTNPIT